MLRKITVFNFLVTFSIVCQLNPEGVFPVSKFNLQILELKEEISSKLEGSFIVVGKIEKYNKDDSVLILTGCSLPAEGSVFVDSSFSFDRSLLVFFKERYNLKKSQKTSAGFIASGAESIKIKGYNGRDLFLNDTHRSGILGVKYCSFETIVEEENGRYYVFRKD